MGDQRRTRDWQSGNRAQEPWRQGEQGQGSGRGAQDEDRWPEDYGRGFSDPRGGAQQRRDRQDEWEYGQQAWRRSYPQEEDSRQDGSSQRRLGERGMDRSGQRPTGEREMSENIQQGAYRGIGPKNYTRSDERLREDVCDRLTEDGDIDASGIEVEVSNGEVTLSGGVPTRDQRRRAEDCAEQVSGAKHVQNNIRVNTDQTPTNQEGIGNMGSRGSSGLGGRTGTGIPK